MRKVIIISVSGIFFLAITYIVYGIFSKTHDQEEIEKQISSLPSFSFTTLNGSSFNSFSINEGPVLIVRFHPECEHCRYEISELVKSEIQDLGIKVLLVTGAEKNVVIKYLSQFNIEEKHEFIPLLDTAYIFNEIFGKDIVPSNYIYNKDLKLVKTLFGEHKIETILKYLEQGE